MDSKKRKGYFGQFGGRFVSELIMPALEELEDAYSHYKKDKTFKKELKELFQKYAGRPTLLYYAANLSKKWKAKVYLKREDMLHTGAHKINNTLGQVLLAKKMGKTRVIAETGAGQHGVATATSAALMGLPCVVYMGEEDLRRQALNGFRINLLGATVKGVGGSKGTLRDAVSEALRDWSQTVGKTHYVVGSAIGPHPFPTMVRDFQAIIGEESKKQFKSVEGKMPDALFACVGGGSNAMGLFYPFINDTEVALVGAEAGGHGKKPGENSATLTHGKIGILQGAKTILLQNKEGQISPVHSISAGLDYPGVGPEHAWLLDSGRGTYMSASDEQALDALQQVSKMEGVIPALETAHAFAAAKTWCANFYRKNKKEPSIIINCSGRGDKDAAEVQRILNQKNAAAG